MKSVNKICWRLKKSVMSEEPWAIVLFKIKYYGVRFCLLL